MGILLPGFFFCLDWLCSRIQRLRNASASPITPSLRYHPGEEELTVLWKWKEISHSQKYICLDVNKGQMIWGTIHVLYNCSTAQGLLGKLSPQRFIKISYVECYSCWNGLHLLNKPTNVPAWTKCIKVLTITSIFQDKKFFHNVRKCRKIFKVFINIKQSSRLLNIRLSVGLGLIRTEQQWVWFLPGGVLQMHQLFVPRYRRYLMILIVNIVLPAS